MRTTRKSRVDSNLHSVWKTNVALRITQTYLQTKILTERKFFSEFQNAGWKVTQKPSKFFTLRNEQSNSREATKIKIKVWELKISFKSEAKWKLQSNTNQLWLRARWAFDLFFPKSECFFAKLFFAAAVQRFSFNISINFIPCNSKFSFQSLNFSDANEIREKFKLDLHQRESCGQTRTVRGKLKFMVLAWNLWNAIGNKLLAL